jgi:DNA-directed RNA polymerase subunit N (RpoN/RPB10)
MLLKGNAKFESKESLCLPCSRMIIPIRCTGCGKLIADKWRAYKRRLLQLKAENVEQPIAMDGTVAITTPEGQVLTELGLTRICCRTRFLTHRDLMDKI